MRSRIIAVMAATVAATAALAQPAHAAPLVDGVYRFAALQDGKCLIWPKPNGNRGMVSLGDCTENANTSANWQVRQRPNGTMEVSTPGSNPRTCLSLATDYRVMANDCAGKYAEWTVSYGSAGPGSAVWADIEHTPSDQSNSWGKLVDDPGVTGRIVVRRAPIEPHYWALQQVG
ncbi:hypothetical protein [Streptomyces sp. NBC_01022]|uniref:hypothetical protein n=1 Tax=Streptomyces sp. NBC_01022 TaxID=2903723 RepID=UPI002DD9A809|nr:hypothetical protein [Streptomyces sp. NBC_01022]WRZ80403.1 hypothetical protein OG316_09050 [Streptomyces sp. NBC_01022]